MAWRHSRTATSFLWALVVLAVSFGAAHPSFGASISYGDFGPIPPGITFGNVTESSGTDAVPLYGAPELVPGGIDFDPTGFVASATSGAQDITDGQLNLVLSGSSQVSITSIHLAELGDYSLAGAGTPATQALVGAVLHVTVTQINGVDVAPITLSAANGSISFNLVVNPGVVQPWSLGVTLDIAAQLGAEQRATRVEVAIDNQLLALSELGSLAFIAKKDFRLDVGTEVPEPSLLLLLFGAGTVLSAAARRARY